MRKFVALAVVGTALASTALAGCGSDDDTPVAQSTWQITNLYVSEDYPSVLPDSIAGKATMVFGDSTIAGFSGCAPFRSRVDFTKDGNSASPADATRVEFKRVNFEDPTGCEGSERFYHDNLVSMLGGGFEIQRKTGDEVLLVKDGEEFDRPAIRLASISRN